MKHLFKTLAALVLATAMSAAPSSTPLTNVQMSGADNQVKSSATLTFKTGSALVFESGVSLPGVQATDATLTALAGQTTAANKITYWTGVDTAATIDFSTVSQTLLTYSTAAAWRNAIFPASGAEGDIITHDGTNWIRLPIGTTGQVPVVQVDGTWAWDDFLVAVNAADVAYDNTTSGLTATDVQTAIDELDTAIAAKGDASGPASSTDNAIARFDSTTGKLLQNSTTTLSDGGLFAFADGVRQIFNPDATNAGLNVGSQSGDPSTPSNGDLWYDSTANELTARINGANVALGAGGGGGIGGSTGSTDNAVLRADGTGGSTAQASTLTVDDVGAITFPEMAAPSTPASGKVALYAKSDGLLYSKDDAGTETVVTGGSGGGGGSGDVVGPASATDNALARFDATTGKLIQNSNVTLADAAGSPLVFVGGNAGITAGSGSVRLTDSSAALLEFSGGILYCQNGSGGTPKIVGTNSNAGIFFDTTNFAVGFSGGGGESARISPTGLLVGTTSTTGLTGNGGLKLSSTTEATSTSAGAAIIPGGLAVAKRFFGAGIALSAEVKTSNYTILATDFAIYADTTSGNVTITLPPSPVNGEIHVVKKINAANTLTVGRNGNNIEGAAADLSTATNLTSYTLQFVTGSGWFQF